MHYNPVVSITRKSRSFLLAVTLPFLMGGACEKKSQNASDNGAVEAADRANQDSGPVDKTPLANVDVSKLTTEQQDLFYKLVGSLTSPCGKGHSLRVSVTQDQTCKRAPFAVRFIVALLDDEASETIVRKEYTSKYQDQANQQLVKVDVTGAPQVGPADAPIRIVEFFDYACPHCADAKEMFDQVVEKHGSTVVEYFKMFPLGNWPDSPIAAAAAYAANAQGKFKEMHTLLFANSPRHSLENVKLYAAQLGMDVAKFEADARSLATKVESDRNDGKAAGVSSTPTIFVNDRKYTGPLYEKYMTMWIEEELAVNR